MTITCEGYDPHRPCPVECQSQMLLDEFRTFRDDFADFRKELGEWKQDKGERIVKLETVVKPALQSNGQPSQISTIDKRVTSLEQKWGKVIAVGAFVWGLITVALHFLPTWGHK